MHDVVRLQPSVMDMQLQQGFICCQPVRKEGKLPPLPMNFAVKVSLQLAWEVIYELYERSSIWTVQSFLALKGECLQAAAIRGHASKLSTTP
eukprot:1157997-Pelagomonas_calceolata.AAC.7